MTNNSIQINSYLQNEMSVEERAAFEDRLAADAALRNELQVQQQIINAVMNAGIKKEFANAIRQRIIIKRSIIGGIAIAAGIAALLIFNSRQNIFQNKPSINTINDVAVLQQKDTSHPFINPPVAGINVPLSEYNLDAEKGDTLYYPSGSIIYFPPSAFVDGSGNPIKGNVKISYREFADPVDFFVSGIPMQYDSAGKQYNFESSGMCEINAYKDGKAVFVNQRAKPEINLSVKNKSPLHNLYFLDTANRKWEFIGKDLITGVKNNGSVKAVVQKDYSAGMPVKPVVPRKADDAHQSFSITVDPNSFIELLAYDHLKFEVVDESTFKGSDSYEEWEDVKLDRTPKEGIYNVTFTNKRRKVTYKVRPVLEDKDYDAALSVFKEKNLVYERALKERLRSEQGLPDSGSQKNNTLPNIVDDKIAWNDKIKTLVDARNKKMNTLKKMKAASIGSDTIPSEQWMQEQLQLLKSKQPKMWKILDDAALSREVIRSFDINKFGVWNCDNPVYQQTEPLFSRYTDSLNNTIYLRNVAVIYKGFNGILQFPQPEHIRVIPMQANMIWGILDSSFYYFSYKDFAAARIQRDTKSFTFRMRKADKQIRSYDEIRELVDKL
ncbi:MAG: hypothetical protein QM737_07795 [Ferruginibacter sp.]